MRYKEDVKIDSGNLDEECIRLASQWQEWADKETKANHELGILEDRVQVLSDKLKSLMAEAHLEIRSLSVERINYKFNVTLDKPTESVYKDLVLMHPDVINAQKDLWKERRALIKARNQYMDFKTARHSFDKKDKMLELLTRLHGQGYFMERKGTKPYRDVKRKAMREKVGQTIKRVKS